MAKKSKPKARTSKSVGKKKKAVKAVKPKRRNAKKKIGTSRTAFKKGKMKPEETYASIGHIEQVEEAAHEHDDDDEMSGNHEHHDEDGDSDDSVEDFGLDSDPDDEEDHDESNDDEGYF